MASFTYVNNSGQDLSAWHKDIIASLVATGALPAEFADVLVARVSPVANDDGSPRYIIEMA